MKLYSHLDDKLRGFIAEQKMFFVATAPLTGEGHVNVSPKGYDSFTIIDDNTVAYLDLGGSGIETLAHVNENGRITIMFCAFKGKANIVRLFGQGEAFNFDHPEFPRLKALFPMQEKARSVIVVKLTRIQDSCGWGVPSYEFISERDQLTRSIDNRDDAAFRDHRYKTNAVSIDGLPGLVRPK